MLKINSFNPRAPRGARQGPYSHHSSKDLFQSTRPARGATFPQVFDHLNRRVSIHAPRAGRDTPKCKYAELRTFQSTRPARGATIADRVIFAAPAGIDVTLVSAAIIPQGAAAGIDDSNKCVIALSDGTSAIVSKEFDADPVFPAAAAVTDLGALDETAKVLAAGEKLYLSVTNGATANPPGFMLQVVYAVADAA